MRLGGEVYEAAIWAKAHRRAPIREARGDAAVDGAANDRARGRSDRLRDRKLQRADVLAIGVGGERRRGGPGGAGVSECCPANVIICRVRYVHVGTDLRRSNGQCGNTSHRIGPAKNRRKHPYKRSGTADVRTWRPVTVIVSPAAHGPCISWPNPRPGVSTRWAIAFIAAQPAEDACPSPAIRRHPTAAQMIVASRALMRSRNLSATTLQQNI